ncbi:TetR/AcrR family transcriptional regulator [Exiguobacterium sp. Leaf196]|uniref:TetR/AcrR family transcriptional regulator n=2 Tax=unclassified Exiguobacterium TaxID=2644629 RepID=UPI000ACF91C3|nr:TetR/AcrR family transcriptional regulator [Exiguobacterium sp. Leaf196]
MIYLKAQQLLQTSIHHFAAHGYEGASLQEIATEVGIKKPSIYAHYKGKDDLFLQATTYALQEQKRRFATYFTKTRQQPLEQSLHGFFDWFILEQQDDVLMRFILRAAYFPPEKLEQEMTERFNPFFDSLHDLLTRLLRERDRTEQILYSTDYKSAALAYLTVAEGTLTELVYNGVDAFHARQQAVWPIVWRGMSKTIPNN